MTGRRMTVCILNPFSPGERNIITVKDASGSISRFTASGKAAAEWYDLVLAPENL